MIDQVHKDHLPKILVKICLQPKLIELEADGVEEVLLDVGDDEPRAVLHALVNHTATKYKGIA